MKQKSRFTEQEHQQATHQTQSEGETHLQFDSVEQMLRHDASHTIVPPSIESRLSESISKVAPSSPLPWWKRLFRT
jgi:hypothetical protein